MFPLKFSFLSQKLINTDLLSLATANIFCQSTSFGHIDQHLLGSTLNYAERPGGVPVKNPPQSGGRKPVRILFSLARDALRWLNLRGCQPNTLSIQHRVL